MTASQENPFKDLQHVRQDAQLSEKERKKNLRADAKEKHKLLFTYFDPLISSTLTQLNDAMGWRAAVSKEIEKEQSTDPIDHADSASWSLEWSFMNKKNALGDTCTVYVGWQRFYVPAGGQNGIDESSVSVKYEYHNSNGGNKEFREEFKMLDGESSHEANANNLVGALRTVVQKGEEEVGRATL